MATIAAGARGRDDGRATWCSGGSTSVAHARNLVEKCERLDAEMSKVEALAAQVRAVKASLSTLESSLGPAERT